MKSKLCSGHLLVRKPRRTSRSTFPGAFRRGRPVGFAEKSKAKSPCVAGCKKMQSKADLGVLARLIYRYMITHVSQLASLLLWAAKDLGQLPLMHRLPTQP